MLHARAPVTNAMHPVMRLLAGSPIKHTRNNT